MRSDEEQLESLKEWWSKNGKSLIAGVVVAVAGVGGWKAWESHQISKAESASQLYSELSQIVMNGTGESRDQQADALIARLTGDFSKSVYADYARLFAARLAVERDELDQAQSHLRAALDSTRVEAIELVARLRLARILNSQERVDEALSLLSVPNAGGFTAEFEALRGDLLMSKGDALQAREAYQKALEASRAAGESAPLVEMKLDSLAIHGDA
ncbi:YfgM family protein [Marinospirillum alkaliphilum]|uniref:Ancillary SecYEG translocon subunit n=1 Tax=Marinospirillum alkaliphilum DSM 21637 TaxID=1122209 RepID=A0A1K1UXG6_9GAMM|nr:tetratricopeptide repeat protein [Marinospirillum alkaliphilum]SFX17496.1 Putative negative regulator of RcsB-dependent stress response [Marinospirillum alkaliphilum DSM 21637]